MTDSIKDLLGGRDFKQPDEIKQIKEFISKKFGETPRVKVTPNSIMITVSNAALAGALRMELYNLGEQLKSSKKLIIKIG